VPGQSIRLAGADVLLLFYPRSGPSTAPLDPSRYTLPPQLSGVAKRSDCGNSNSSQPLGLSTGDLCGAFDQDDAEANVTSRNRVLAVQRSGFRWRSSPLGRILVRDARQRFATVRPRFVLANFCRFACPGKYRATPALSVRHPGVNFEPARAHQDSSNAGPSKRTF
jgi:hypothetical protein